MSTGSLPFAALTLSLLAVPRLGAASAEGPLPGHTGGFGEPTCADCHQGPEPGEGAGVEIHGLPGAWTAGEVYAIDIEVRGESLRRGGFQLAARWATGPAEGTQAGRFELSDPRVRVTEADHITYVHHTYDGTKPAEPGRIRWTLHWRAPIGEGTGAIAFHVAANAANDDNSEFGDIIVTTSTSIPPAFRLGL